MSWRKPDAVRAALARPESKPASRQEERKKEDETGAGIPVPAQTGVVGVDTKGFIVQASSAEGGDPAGSKRPYEAVGACVARVKAQLRRSKEFNHSVAKNVLEYMDLSMNLETHRVFLKCKGNFF